MGSLVSQTTLTKQHGDQRVLVSFIKQQIEIMDELEWSERMSLMGIIVCKDCGHVAMNNERHVTHLQEARHINTFRFLAYREPKNRSTWLKIWHKNIEKLEREDPWALAFDEEEELEETRTL